MNRMARKAHAGDSCGLAVRYVLFALLLSAAIGLGIAAFIFAIECATLFRFAHLPIIVLLPFSGLLTVFVARNFMKGNPVGTDPVLDGLVSKERNISLNGGFFVYIATILSQLFGASVGREGTAVQFGAAMAASLSRLPFLKGLDARVVLAMGVAAGFGAVFDAPFGGAVFACEFLIIRQIAFRLLTPCLIAALGATAISRLTGVGHPVYAVHSYFSEIWRPDWHALGLFALRLIVCGACLGLAARIFADGLYFGTQGLKKLVPSDYLRIFLGGIATVVLAYGIHDYAYLGLGILAAHPFDPSILHFFNDRLFDAAWAWKIVFTLLALCSGFKGGEVTPLFFIGAGLGNMLAFHLGLPLDLVVSAGLVGVFSAASNTPVAGIVMALELFGPGNGIFYALIVSTAYLCSGRRSSIYMGQRFRTLSPLTQNFVLLSLKEWRGIRKDL